MQNACLHKTNCTQIAAQNRRWNINPKARRRMDDGFCYCVTRTNILSPQVLITHTALHAFPFDAIKSRKAPQLSRLWHSEGRVRPKQPMADIPRQRVWPFFKTFFEPNHLT